MADAEEFSAVFDAYELARTWLAVAIAQSDDSSRPVLYRSTLVEWHTDGIRLVSTDSYILLRGWVPYRDARTETEPKLNRRPAGSVVVTDIDKRAAALFTFLRSETKGQPEGKAEPIDVVLSTRPADPGAQATLDGLSATRFAIEVPAAERLLLGTFDGDFPAWRPLLTEHVPTPTDTLGVGPGAVLRLGQLSKLYGHTPLRLEFAGPHRPVMVSLTDTSARVSGLAMPVRDHGDDRPPADDAPYPDAVRLMDPDTGEVVAVDEDPAGAAEATGKKTRRRLKSVD